MTIDPPRQPMTPTDYDRRALDRDDLLAELNRLDRHIAAFLSLAAVRLCVKSGGGVLRIKR